MPQQKVIKQRRKKMVSKITEQTTLYSWPYLTSLNS